MVYIKEQLNQEELILKLKGIIKELRYKYDELIKEYKELQKKYLNLRARYTNQNDELIRLKKEHPIERKKRSE